MFWFQRVEIGVFIDLDSFGVCIGTLVLFVTRCLIGIWGSNRFSAGVCCNLIEIHSPKKEKEKLLNKIL